MGKPQETVMGDAAPSALHAERVVISGMSGLYPDSANVKQLEEILYKKQNPVSAENCRWAFKHPEVKQETGKLPGLDRFDGQFFMVHYRLGNYMDPTCRKILEHTYQAIYDAGVNPADLSGKKIGVYTGSCSSETEKYLFYGSTGRSGFGLAGCNKAMLANRISYWLNTKGPSMVFNAACCSSLIALEKAYHDINKGECEAALVAGGNLFLHPHSTIVYGRTIKLSLDGKTKSFDEDADGSSLSEAINVLFLQKASDAKRVYAEIVHVKSQFTGTMEGERSHLYGFSRDPSVTASFLKEFYNEAKVSPQAIEYVEATGSATPQADKSELEAYDEVFCKGRTNPLLVGSVMSNIGFGEAASGISAITKVLLGYTHGEMAGNLHCKKPRQDVSAVREGRIQILQDHAKFNRSLVAVNQISITGVNSHVLLQGYYKPKDVERYKSEIPRLVAVSGRQDVDVKNILEEFKSHPIDPEEHALFHNIHQKRIAGHLGRGYTILDTKEGKTVALSETAAYFDDATRPLWFVYSGMGSQWVGMGKHLLRIPVFAAAIERCRKTLEPKGIDIVHIITSQDKTMFDNILHSFVGIAAIQIGLTDVLTSVGIKPDNIIGHSVGELGCAYADGCFTTEEMILSAYSRGLVSVQTPFIKGSMAAVGVGYQQVVDLIPPEIEVACHNGPESSTISGPVDILKEFVAKLTVQGIFAKEVPCSNIAFHSRYIAQAGPRLKEYLSKVIRNPKPRSERWVSTSIPQERWDEPIAKYSSAQYHTNNLLSPVLFEETSCLIPANAVCIEIAPHGLLQAILKRSLPESCKHIPLTRRGHSDNALMVLDSIGKLYVEGYNPKIQNLYPKISFPVSTGTPMLSHLVKWAHGEKWDVSQYQCARRKMAASSQSLICLFDAEYSYLRGNVLRGKPHYPFAAALVAVWDTYCSSLNQKHKTVSLQFRDVQLFCQPILHEKITLRIEVAIHRVTGLFEVTNGDRKIVTGHIKTAFEDNRLYHLPLESNEVLDITADDVYEMLFERDFVYRDAFRSIHKASKSFNEAEIIWKDDWVTFLDGILQIHALRNSHDTVAQPNQIRQIMIDVKEHKQYIEILKEDYGKKLVPAHISELHGLTRCGGVVMENVQFRKLPILDEQTVTLKYPKLFPRFNASIGENPDGEYQLSCEELSTLKLGVTLRCGRVGDFNSLHWVEAGETLEDGIPVNVQYTALNDLDVKKASGVIPNKKESELSYCMDFSGITDSGTRVMGVVASGAASSRVKVNKHLLWPVPEHWTLEDAVTVPSAYMHAYYCLAIKVNFRRACKILIHGGCGAMGQAAIAVALANDCEVFTTVSDVRKKRFLMKLFPELKEDHIGNSRDQSFADMVRGILGKDGGCDVAISCVTGELRNVTMYCLNTSGITLDTVQILNQEPFIFGMYYLTKDTNYLPIDFTSVFEDSDQLQSLQKFISEGIARGYVRPLSRVTYSPDEVPRAFKLLAASRHRGRVVLKLNDKIKPAKPGLICSPDLTHVVLCDGYSLGMHLAERLIKRGVRNLHIHCANNPTKHLLLKVQSWEDLGVKVQISSEDLTSSKGIITLLTDSNQMAPVEGIFILTNDVDKDMAEKVISNVDLASRKMCPTVRYFAVIGAGLLGHKTCIARQRDNLPATILNIHSLKESDSMTIPGERALHWRAAVSAIERALRSSQLLLTAHACAHNQRPLLQQITAVADVELPGEITEDTTLIDLGMEMTKVPAVRSYLTNMHDVALSEDAIPGLSVKKIKELEEAIFGYDLPLINGLETFFSYVDSDELLSTTELTFLPTRTNTTCEKVEFDVSKRYLCIIPGLEGHYHRFRVLCERLKTDALILQPGLDHLQESFRDTADRYAEILMNKACLKNNFYLLGYESGVLIALEVAAILEDHGLTGTVFCVGGTPEEFHTELEKQLHDIPTDEALQDAVARHMFSLMAGSTDGVDKVLQNASAWKDKIGACVRTLLGNSQHSAQYASNLMEAAYTRIKMARSYNVQPRQLKSKLILLYANDMTAGDDSANLLQRYSQQPVSVYELSEPLAHCTQDLRCSAIINDNLDEEIIAAYEERNICDTYLLLADQFTTSESDVMDENNNKQE